VLWIWIIGSAAWLTLAMVTVIKSFILRRYRIDAKDNLLARRVFTQLGVIERIFKVRILENTSLWDQRVGVLQVTGARKHTLELRALMSAEDSPTAWSLRCHVREKLIEFMQRKFPQSLPICGLTWGRNGKRHKSGTAGQDCRDCMYRGSYASEALSGSETTQILRKETGSPLSWSRVGPGCPPSSSIASPVTSSNRALL
jgi:hypothetical protein